MCHFCGHTAIDGESDGITLVSVTGRMVATDAWQSHARSVLEGNGLEIANADELIASMTEDGPAAPTGAADPAPALFEPFDQTPENDAIAFSGFFDIPSGPGTNIILPVGGRITAEISTPNDTDWFRMFLVEGETYEINLNSLPFLGLGDPELYLFDNNGVRLTFDDNGGVDGDSRLVITATRTGVYYAGATGFGGDAQTVGQYSIGLSRVDFDADIVGDDPSLSVPINVNETITGTIDFGADEDWYAVTLEKGRVYAVVLESAALSFTPLRDPLVEIVDSQLAEVASNDDNGITKDSFVSFEIQKTGTYYIKALGGRADTGDYRLTVADFTPPPPANPVDGVDWGVKLANTKIKYYFTKAGETFFNETTDRPWTNYEKGQALAAMREYTKVSKLTFTEVNSADKADFVLLKSFLDSDLTGRMAPPDPEFGPDQGKGWFNTNPVYWSDKRGGLLEKGAYGYSNFMHEFGHGVGLAHPHDDGGGTSAVFDGVANASDVGTRGLNQEVFTVMSYNKGWGTGPAGSSPGNEFGLARTLMAFDIAAVQEKYGANNRFARGDDTYELFTQNERGTGYEAIWDTGGTDTIINPGRAPAVIDLRAATLKVEEGGGGFVSYVSDIFGGLTIANGVTIENAVGGRGRDTITGNNADNHIDGGRGADRMAGGRGDDTFVVDNKRDRIQEAGNKRAGDDTIETSNLSIKLKAYKNVENVDLTGRKNLKADGDSGDNDLSGNRGNNVLKGLGGNDTLSGDEGRDRLFGGPGKDVFAFGPGFGRDTVRDYRDGTDVIDLTAFDLKGYGQVRRLFEQDGRDAILDFGDGDRLTIRGHDTDDFNPGDFII